MVSASSTPTSHNRNETDSQPTVVYVGSRLFVSGSTSHFLDCVSESVANCKKALRAYLDAFHVCCLFPKTTNGEHRNSIDHNLSEMKSTLQALSFSTKMMTLVLTSELMTHFGICISICVALPAPVCWLGGYMKVSQDAFNQGLELGSRRATEHFNLTANRERANTFYEVLTQWPGEGNARFVSLLTEIWVVADVARTYNKDAALTRDQLFGFVGTMYWFMNSFKHR